MSYVTLNDTNFDQEVLKSDIPVLVDFWAPWCGPCRMLSPIIEELSGEYSGKVKIAKCNTDECPNTANRYGIQGIPSLLIFHNGELKKTNTGVLPKADIVKMFSSFI